MQCRIGNRVFHYFFITVIGLVFTVPAFLSNFYSGHDVLIHLLWSRHFAEQLWSGDLYPRWLMGMNSGLGSPAFFFYFPAPYFFTSIFYALFPNSTGWLQLGLSSATALILSGIGAYLWLRKLVDPNSAAIAAVLYMIMPYHLLVDLYMRFAFAEFWAFAWIPFILYYSHLLVEKKEGAILSYAISYALLILTHLPATLIFTPIAIAYLFILRGGQSVMKKAFRACLAYFLAAGLSSIYLIPAITTQNNIAMEVMTNGKYNYSRNFIFSALNLQSIESHDFIIYISFTTVMAFMVSILSIYVTENYHDKMRQKYLWLTISVLSFFMMLEISSIAWDHFPPLQRIQFPYRLNILLTTAVTALLAFATSGFGKIHSYTKKLAVVMIAAFFLSQTILTGLTVYKRVQGEWDPEKKRAIAVNLVASPEVAEYKPRWAAPSLFSFDGPAKRPSALVEGGTAEVKLYQPRRIIVATNVEKESILKVRHLFYPGWSATVDGLTERDIQVFPSPEGLISLTVPGGDHLVELFLRRETGERAGMLLTGISLVVVLGLLARRFLVERRNHGT